MLTKLVELQHSAALDLLSAEGGKSVFSELYILLGHRLFRVRSIISMKIVSVRSTFPGFAMSSVVVSLLKSEYFMNLLAFFTIERGPNSLRHRNRLNSLYVSPVLRLNAVSLVIQ